MMRNANQRWHKLSADVTGYNENKIRSHWLLIIRSRGSIPPPVKWQSSPPTCQETIERAFQTSHSDASRWKLLWHVLLRGNPLHQGSVEILSLSWPPCPLRRPRLSGRGRGLGNSTWTASPMSQTQANCGIWIAANDKMKCNFNR